MESFDLEYRLSCPRGVVLAELDDPAYLERPELTTVKGAPYVRHRTEPHGAGTRSTLHLEPTSRLPCRARLIRRPLEPRSSDR